MPENETTTDVEETIRPRKKLARKVLILSGAAVGLILAGGLAFKYKDPEEEPLVDAEVVPDATA